MMINGACKYPSVNGNLTTSTVCALPVKVVTLCDTGRAEPLATSILAADFNNGRIDPRTKMIATVAVIGGLLALVFVAVATDKS